MCNCGNKRTSISASPYSSSAVIPAQQEKMWPDIAFVYTGKTALTIKGTVTGKQYRFGAPGTSLLVDFRDAAAMMYVPVLKRIK